MRIVVLEADSVAWPPCDTSSASCVGVKMPRSRS
jgi:hypothetical protein